MNVNRKLFLALTASIASTSACKSENSVSSDANVDARVTELDTGVLDSGAADTDSSTADTDSGTTEADSGVTITDAGPPDAGWPPPLSDGGVGSACAPFTCEIGELECFGAYSNAFVPSVAAALYDCAEAQCSLEDEYDRTCMTAALSIGPAPTADNPLCAPLSECPVETINVEQCEDILAGVTEEGLADFATYLGKYSLGCGTPDGLAYEVISWARDLSPK